MMMTNIFPLTWSPWLNKSKIYTRKFPWKLTLLAWYSKYPPPTTGGIEIWNYNQTPNTPSGEKENQPLATLILVSARFIFLFPGEVLVTATCILPSLKVFVWSYPFPPFCLYLFAQCTQWTSCTTQPLNQCHWLAINKRMQLSKTQAGNSRLLDWLSSKEKWDSN